MTILAQIFLALMPLTAVPGWDCREGWELIAIWGAAAAYSLLLSSWWRRAFLWVALFQLALNPAAVSYAGFAMIAAFLGAAEAFKRIDPGRVMRCMAIGAGSLGALMVLQLVGVIPVYSPYGHAAGFFNPGSAGVYLALCLPAFVHVWWAAVGCLALIAVTHSTTAMVAGAAVMGMWVCKGRKGQKGRKVWIAAAAGVVLLALTLLKLDPIGRTVHQDPRWELWRQTVQTYRSAPLGRGIGSYQQIMPYFIAGNSDLVSTRNLGAVDGKPVLSQDIWWNYAHNEFLQAGFELGLPGLALAGIWVGSVGIGLIRRRRELSEAGIRAGVGIMTLAVASLGWFPLHLAPLALVGMAWVGVWESAKAADKRENGAVGGRSRQGVGVWS